MRPASTLSSSALSYLESLEKNSKALRTTKSALNKPRKPSISEIISQARRNSSLTRTDSEEVDFLNESLKSSMFSEDSGEKVILFSSDSDDDTASQKLSERILPRGTPGAQVGRKSLKAIRELRNSIDQSLIKTPEVAVAPGSQNNSTRKEKPEAASKILTNFEKIDEEIEEDSSLKKNNTMTTQKSPFKKYIESESSDAESIIFDEVFEESPVVNEVKQKAEVQKPQKPEVEPKKIQKTQETRTPDKKAKTTKEKKKQKRKPPSPSSSSASSSKSDSESESESESSSDSESDSESETASKSEAKSSSSSSSESESTSESESSSSESESVATVIQPIVTPPKPKSSTSEPDYYEDFFPSPSTVREEKKQKVPEPKSEVQKPEIQNPSQIPEILPSTSTAKKLKENHRSSKKEDKTKKIEPPSESGIDSEASSHRIKSRKPSKSLRRKRQDLSSGLDSGLSERDNLCHSNVHDVMKVVINTHLKLINDFNQVERESVNNWKEILNNFGGHDGPTTSKLRELIEQRVSRDKYM